MDRNDMTEAISNSDLPLPIKTLAMIKVNTMGREEASKISAIISDCMERIREGDQVGLANVLADAGVPEEFVILIKNIVMQNDE